MILSPFRLWRQCGDKKGHTPATTHLVRDGTTHRGDQDDAPFIPEPGHLPPCSLRSVQHPVRVDTHHLTSADQKQEKQEKPSINRLSNTRERKNAPLQIAHQGTPDNPCALSRCRPQQHRRPSSPPDPQSLLQSSTSPSGLSHPH